MYKNFKLIDKIVYGRGSFNQLHSILNDHRESHVVFVVDDVFIGKPLEKLIPIEAHDMLLWVSVKDEPTTYYVDELTSEARNYSERRPSAIVGIGGGSTMDLAKAISLMLTNDGSSEKYQGWDLINYPAIYHIAVPTLSGTGSEVSRTTVLTGPVKKLGLNSDYTVFNQVILDPDLISDVPKDQWFYTGMDCYVHNVEALAGTYINEFARSFGEKSIELCRDVFLTDLPKSIKDEKLMMASFMGGMSIAYSQVGVCHALSYGISYILKTHHGLSNCIVFNKLDEFYPEYVEEFRRMMFKNDIVLPQNITANCTDEQFERMIDVSMVLEPLWENALGKNWKTKISREKILGLFKSM